MLAVSSAGPSDSGSQVNVLLHDLRERKEKERKNGQNEIEGRRKSPTAPGKKEHETDNGKEKLFFIEGVQTWRLLARKMK
jgi:hypothetical protein